VSLPLFVYGSLRDPSVRARVLGERAGSPPITTGPAVLRGFRWQMVDGFGYPFVLPATANDTVDGDILGNLDGQDYLMLDRYEDTDSGRYVRVQVTVETATGRVAAWTYCKGPGAPS